MTSNNDHTLDTVMVIGTLLIIAVSVISMPPAYSTATVAMILFLNILHVSAIQDSKIQKLEKQIKGLKEDE